MKKSSLALTALFLFIYILPLGMRPFTVPDESRYAEIPREILVTGDWVVPRLNGLRYFEKPVLGYWLNALSIALLGENTFAMRLSSALATGISALMVFFILRRFGGGTRVGMVGAAAYLTSLLVFALGVINILDSMLSMFLTGALVSFFAAYRRQGPARFIFLALFGSFCGLAFLVKGFLAFAVPVITIVPFMIWERRFIWFFRLLWVPLLTLLLVTLPWAIMIHIREGDFWNYFFWTEHIKRFFSPIPGQHQKPFWYFIPVLAGGALPWTFTVPAVLSGIRDQGLGRDPLVRFALCWFIFPFLFFSACGGKLIPYILPCFPPLVIVIAIGLESCLERGRVRAFNLSALLLAMVTGGAAVVLAVTQIIDLPGFRAYGPQEIWKWMVATAGLMVWGGALLLSSFWSDTGKKLALFVAGPLVLLASVNFIVPDRVMEEKAPGALLERNRHLVNPRTLVVSDEYLFHAVCWTFRRSDVYLLERSGELRYGLDHDESGHLRLLTVEGLRKIVEGSRGRTRVALITEEKRWREWRDLLPEPEIEERDNGFVFVIF
ncbi:MAG: phospholipid carrier-dependent glycosyltransferase [Deltaproteobacteria bacterium]|nr:phospholipid carrier-dependent glycosyltransferase [Deltaproteobacteria bacterium]MBW2049082.1 phospholipid carrier-dependent glycosyltransferase [Deltaproteobacteria bacterium]MBW2112478.1 phospholipid carrier-dependent glycosyltransferase [Deltaproteobacteria bacterium]MBW2354733.1 phospholipid carrier-dependent glycosyltransferase [Deltaproteobacteria bacterium]HDZ89923.1 phospholipid carrier-dependent glycosyltransferase [Deltaproteobacteria bacterium]